jgi:ABC-type nitrate/sulfonate/bicarbonate transport system substrate-binding protein
LAGCANASGGSGGRANQLRLGYQPPYIVVSALRRQAQLTKAITDAGTTTDFRQLLTLDPITEAITGNSLDLGIGGTPVAALAAGQPFIAVVEKSPRTQAVLVKQAPPSRHQRVCAVRRSARPAPRRRCSWCGS